LSRIAATDPDSPAALDALARGVRAAARRLAALDTAARNALLDAIASRLGDEADAILAANAEDLDAARAAGLGDAMLDRLRLDRARLDAIANAIREVAALPDPVGRIEWSDARPSGIEVGRMQVPLGVILMIYEARPNVTVDAAALCLKSGNAVILRGGSEAFRSNTALANAIGRALDAQGLPRACAQLVPTTSRAAMEHLLTLDHCIDLVIPRGGEGLIRFVAERSRIPVIRHYKGVCHLYVDADADPDLAERLLIDGKTSRPAVCNALETLLVDRAVAPTLLPRLAGTLAARGVAIRGDAETRRLWPDADAATESDYDIEHLDLRINIAVVDGLDGALDHIARHGSNHTEVIVTRDPARAARFQREADASAVMWNASSRFNDGGELGLGAEIGISTTKLHAYGPMGLDALTTRKFIVRGEGQTRHPV
jgi:glutamate-5-semialdehyde dehydrogenase